MNIHTTLLHLSLIDDVGPATVKQILDHKPKDFDLVSLYSLLPSDFTHLFGLPSATAAKISKGLADRAILERELALIEKHAMSWVTVVDDEYPAPLKAIHLPPVVLYCQGTSLSSAAYANGKLIALVGSRQANQYGQRAIDQIVPPLVAHDWAIVSGGALGIDAMAHRAAVDAGGRTAAVLGSGLLQPYPASNRRLFDAIVDTGGTMVSAFPLQMEPLPGNFPARNRVIAGLSRGCVVVQAAAKSGARITAQFALEQSREVFALPGHFDDPLSAGCHALIQEGAKLVMGVEDILAEFEFDYSIADAKSEKASVIIKSAQSVEKPAQKPVKSTVVYDKASAEGIIVHALTNNLNSVDDLIGATGLSLSALNGKLFELQIAGVITQNFMGQWELAG
jgi:DNA processing protein